MDILMLGIYAAAAMLSLTPSLPSSTNPGSYRQTSASAEADRLIPQHNAVIRRLQRDLDELRIANERFQDRNDTLYDDFVQRVDDEIRIARKEDERMRQEMTEFFAYAKPVGVFMIIFISTFLLAVWKL